MVTKHCKPWDFYIRVLNRTASCRYLHERLSQLQQEANLLKTNLTKYKVNIYFFKKLTSSTDVFFCVLLLYYT